MQGCVHVFERGRVRAGARVCLLVCLCAIFSAHKQEEHMISFDVYGEDLCVYYFQPVAR